MDCSTLFYFSVDLWRTRWRLETGTVHSTCSPNGASGAIPNNFGLIFHYNIPLLPTSILDFWNVPLQQLVYWHNYYQNTRGRCGVYLILKRPRTAACVLTQLLPKHTGSMRCIFNFFRIYKVHPYISVIYRIVINSRLYSWTFRCLAWLLKVQSNFP